MTTWNSSSIIIDIIILVCKKMLPATIVAGFMQHKRTFQLSFPRSAQLQNALDNTEDEKIWENDSDPDPLADIEDYADE